MTHRRLERLLLAWAFLTAAAVTIGWLLGAVVTSVSTTAVLAAAALVLGAFVVHLEVGTISLTAIPLFVSAALLSPAEAAVVGLAGNIVRTIQVRSSIRIPLAFAYSVWTASAALVATVTRHELGVAAGAVAGIVGALTLNIVVTVISVAAWNDLSIRRTVSATTWRTVSEAYAYFVLGALSVVLALSKYGDYLLALSIMVLCFALTYGTSRRELDELARRELLAVGERLRYVEHVDSELHRLKNFAMTALTWLGSSGRPLTASAADMVRDALRGSAIVLEQLGREASASIARPQVNDMVALAREAVRLMEPTTLAAGVSLRDQLGSEPMAVRCERLSLRDAITNLISNAVKASGRGGAVDIYPGRTTRLFLISVRDWGGGVPDDLVPRLFTERKASTSGGGMGLMSAYMTARRYGGDVTYQRRRGGSEFTIRLPRAVGAGTLPERRR